MSQRLQSIIDAAWDNRDALTPASQGEERSAVAEAIEGLDNGRFRVAEKTDDGWQVNQWLKKAVLLFFRLHDMTVVEGGPRLAGQGGSVWYDKVPLKCVGWTDETFQRAAFRSVPDCVIRQGAYIAPSVVVMPSFVNIGAYVDKGTMIDSWATVGSCAQIGKNCHISAQVCVGGVLEPLQADPVVIEDNAFIGACSAVTEGVRIEEGAVLSMGVQIGASTKIIDRETGEVFRGRVPAYSVVVPGTLPGKPLADGTPGPSLACAVIVKRVDEGTRAKASINDLLRDNT